MGQSAAFQGDVNVGGTFSCAAFNPPQACIGDAAVIGGAAIDPTKNVQQYLKVYKQESATTAVSEQRVEHVVVGSISSSPTYPHASSVVDFRAGSVVANAGAATITVDLLKNGVSILTAAIVLNNTHVAYQKVVGALAAAASNLANGDVLEVKITAAAGGGTLGKGVFAQVVLRENPS